MASRTVARVIGEDVVSAVDIVEATVTAMAMPRLEDRERFRSAVDALMVTVYEALSLARAREV